MERKYVKRLPDAYAKHTDSNNNKLLQVNRMSLDNLYESIAEVLSVLDIDNAEGAILDDYGEMLNVYRGKLTDRQYKAVIKAIIAANISKSDYMSVMFGLDYIFGKNNAHVAEVEDSICRVKLDDMPFSALMATGLSAMQVKDILKRLIAIAVQIEESNFWGTFEFGNTIESYVLAIGNPVTLSCLSGGVPFNEIAVSGKNLIPYPYYETTKTVNGVTFTNNGDGSITIDGTATANTNLWLYPYGRDYMYLKENVSYYLSGNSCISGEVIISLGFYSGNTWIKAVNDTGNGKSFRISHSSNYDSIGLSIFVAKNAVCDNITVYPQLELGDTATEYAPPITGREMILNVNGAEYTITPDSNPYTVPTEIIQENGLNNVSVSSGTVSVKGTVISCEYDETKGFGNIKQTIGGHFGAIISGYTSVRTRKPLIAVEPSNTRIKYNKPAKITITSQTKGAKIYYTVDGKDPTNKSTEYTEPFELYSESYYGVSKTIKAIAYSEKLDPSIVSERVVEWKPALKGTFEFGTYPPQYDANKGFGNINQTKGGYFGDY